MANSLSDPITFFWQALTFEAEMLVPCLLAVSALSLLLIANDLRPLDPTGYSYLLDRQDPDQPPSVQKDEVL